MLRRADTIEQFLKDPANTYIVTVKGNVVLADDKYRDLLLIKNSPFSVEPQVTPDERERLQILLGVELMRGVRVFSGKYYKLKKGHAFAYSATREDSDEKTEEDILLEAQVTDSSRKAAVELFDLLSEWHSPVMYVKDVSFLKMIIRKSKIKKEVRINLKSLF